MSLLDIFKPKLRLTGYVYKAEEHQGWGNAIRWFDFDKRKLVGHLSRLPKVGDEVQFNMESGKVARFAISSVKYCSDPPDMWFADAMDIGYVGEKPINKVKETTP